MTENIESAYLKNHIGAILAKGIAETVVAQPANPQEYLALYLLHQLQEQERISVAAHYTNKIAAVEKEWATDVASRERAAGVTISRAIAAFRAKVARRKAAEERLQRKYNDAVGEAEELLEQEEGIREDHTNGSGGDVDYEAGLAGESRTQYETLQEQEEKFLEARGSFYKAQRFILNLQKGDLGALKIALGEHKDRIRAAKAALESIADNTAADEREAAELDWRLSAPSGGGTNADQVQSLSAAAAELARVAAGHRSHDRVSAHHVLYRVLRCLCYLCLDATPAATDSAVKVAALIKPTVLAAALRGFNPVAGYDRAVPLRLERNLPGGGGDGGDEEDEEGGGGGSNHNDGRADDDAGGRSYPMPQPKPRQARRAARVMRSVLADGEYLALLSPADFFDEEYIEERLAEEAEAAVSGGGGGGTSGSHNNISGSAESLQSELDASAAAAAKAKSIRATVEGQTKQRGGVALWALLRFFAAAVSFRESRDAVVATRRELGLDVSSSGDGDDGPARVSTVTALLEEPPEEEEEDPLNDEAVFDEDGNPDAAEVRRLQEKIGVDEDERLVKMWEARDQRRRKELQGRAEAFRKSEEDEEDEEGGGHDDDDGDDEE